MAANLQWLDLEGCESVLKRDKERDSRESSRPKRVTSTATLRHWLTLIRLEKNTALESGRRIDSYVREQGAHVDYQDSHAPDTQHWEEHQGAIDCGKCTRRYVSFERIILAQNSFYQPSVFPSAEVTNQPGGTARKNQTKPFRHAALGYQKYSYIN